MKAKFILLLSILVSTLCLIPKSSIAQNPIVKWGPESNEGDKKSINYPIGWHDKKYYNLRLEYQIYTNKYIAVLEQMSESMKVLSAKELAYDSKAGINLEYVDFSNETVYIYSSTFESSKDKLILFREEFNLVGKKTGNNELASIPIPNRNSYTSFMFSKSPDGNTLSALHKVGRKKGEPLRYQIVTIPVSDPGSTNLYENKIHFTDYGVNIEDQEIDNDGDVLFIVQTQLEKKGELESYLLVYSNNSVSDRIDLEYGNYILDNFSIETIADGSIKLAGFYLSKEKKKSFYEGFFLCTFDAANKKITDFSTAPLSQELISKFGKRAAKKGTAETSGNYHVQIIENNNGSGFVIAESRNIVSSGDKTHHIFGEIMVANFNNSGELTHLNLVPKKQQDSYTRPSTSPFGLVTIYFEPPYGYKKLVELFSSYSAFCSEGVLFILFNDDEKNDDVETLDDTKVIFDANKAVTRLYSITSDGEIKSKTFFENKEVGGFFVTSKSYFEEEPYVIGLMKRKSIRYGTINLK